MSALDPPPIAVKRELPMPRSDGGESGLEGEKSIQSKVGLLVSLPITSSISLKLATIPSESSGGVGSETTATVSGVSPASAYVTTEASEPHIAPSAQVNTDLGNTVTTKPGDDLVSKSSGVAPLNHSAISKSHLYTDGNPIKNAMLGIIMGASTQPQEATPVPSPRKTTVDPLPATVSSELQLKEKPKPVSVGAGSPQVTVSPQQASSLPSSQDNNLYHRSTNPLMNDGIPMEEPISSVPETSQHDGMFSALQTSKPGSQESDYGPFTIDEVINLLVYGLPTTMAEYADHLFKIGTLVYEELLPLPQFFALEQKFYKLMELLDYFSTIQPDPVNSQLHLLVQRNFDIFIKISTNHKKVDFATRTVRFLTDIIMRLNYWEIYNLLVWKPALYKFLQLINFDMNECYTRFLKDYSAYTFAKAEQSKSLPRPKRRKLAPPKEKELLAVDERGRARNRKYSEEGLSDGELSSRGTSQNGMGYDDLSDSASEYSEPESISSDTEKRKRRRRSGSDSLVSPSSANFNNDPGVPYSSNGQPKRKYSKMAEGETKAAKVIKKVSSKPSNKSSNYDPDVVHECQLPSPDEPHKLCLRRFSRKYELIRHQETVHSKKKKLFKCFVCVKQNPTVGPRIFTRHDTLAKHIRVNHKISGKEAKAEVAFLKRHAEVVEEGDITVHVGRRKTKVDFELRKHMEKKRMEKRGLDSSPENLDEEDDDLDDEEVKDIGDESFDQISE